MEPRHSQFFRVRSYEVDHQGRLQTPVLCRLLQEAATVHAACLGVAVEALIDRGVAWVLTRLDLEMIRWPGIDDVVNICTWPEAMNRVEAALRFRCATVWPPMLTVGGKPHLLGSFPVMIDFEVSS